MTNLIDTPSPKRFAERKLPSLQTTLAVLFHQRSNQRTLELVTAHAVVHNGNGTPIIGAGRPLTRGDERKIVALLRSRTKEHAASPAVFPANLLFSDADRAVWYVPASVRPMHLRDTNGDRQVIFTGWPNLIMRVIGRSLSVATFAGDERPRADTPLLESTLPNVYEGGRVCTGDATLPLGCALSELPAWESVIFDSAFTHSNNHRALNASRSGKTPNVEDFWRKRDGTTTPFPYHRAARMGVTLGEWLVAGESSNE